MIDKRFLTHGGTAIRPPPVRAITAPMIISISAHSGGSETNSWNVGDNEAGCFAGWGGAGVPAEEEAGGPGRVAPIGATMDAGVDRCPEGPKLGGGAGVGVGVAGSCRNTTALVVAAKLPSLLTPARGHGDDTLVVGLQHEFHHRPFVVFAILGVDAEAIILVGLQHLLYTARTLDRINFQAQVQSCVMKADYRMLSLIRFSPCTASEHEGTFA